MKDYRINKKIQVTYSILYKQINQSISLFSLTKYLCIKNISKPVKIEFGSKKTLEVKDLNGQNVKAIYGPNGSGKTAIVHGFNILKNILTSSNYLQDSKSVNQLNELVNKLTNSIEIRVEFIFYREDQNGELFNYEFKLEKTTSGFDLSYEKYSKINKTGNETIIILIKNGEFFKNPKGFDISSFKNLLKKSFFNDIYMKEVLQQKKGSPKLDYHVLVNTLFSFLLVDILDQKDKHKDADINNEKMKKLNFSKPSEFQKLLESFHIYEDHLIDEIQFEMLKEKLKRKEAFIKVFKPEVKQLLLEKQLVYSIDSKNKYKVNEIIDYGAYKVNVEYESIGIKKLLNLYNSLTQLNKGAMLIIDELDSHINDVYLIKLVEYILEYSRGQLIFTTHNISPMEILKKNKFGIDFMTMDGQITKYAQIGNYSPINLYRSGMIKGLPFNVQIEDFLYALGENE